MGGKGAVGGAGRGAIPVSGDPEFRGCTTASRCEGPSCPPASPGMPGPGHLRPGSPSVSLDLDEPPQLIAQLGRSAGDIEWRLAPEGNVVSTLTWNGSAYDPVPISAEAVPDPGSTAFVSARGASLPAFSGELVVPARIHLSKLPIGFVVRDGAPAPATAIEAGGAGGMAADEGDAGQAGQAGTASPNIWRFEWSAEGEQGLVEISVESVFKPDAQATIVSTFCRVPATDGAVEVASSAYPGRTEATIRVVTLDTAGDEPAVTLFGVRQVASLVMDPVPLAP